MNYLVYLHSIGFSHKLLHKIFEKEKNYKSFYEELSSTVLKKYVDKEEQIDKILHLKNTLNISEIDKKIEKLGIQIIPHYDINYPKLLKNISHTPYFLYVRGELKGDDNFFSVVGSRKMSLYAKKAGESILPKLMEYFTIVSGGAGGCDTLAHQICLDKNAKTIVVFGTGIDIIYPSGNKKLFQKVIEKSGALISIFPLGTLGNIYTFPVRNEIVAGLSSGLLVLEASQKSGTLITANLALEQSKEVFAIPGDIFAENYMGANSLIQKGEAKLVQNAEDILQEYGYKILPSQKEIHFENEIQENIYTLLKYNLGLSIDEFIEKSQYEYGLLAFNLSYMELQNLIKKDAFGKYQIMH
ncbi:MAG: DNA-processing protein DprA [Candidatus Altimarinota bacterium]